MNTFADTYLKAAYPPPLQPPHLSDEDIAEQLEQSTRRSKAAQKGSETRRQKRAQQATSQEKR